MYYIGIDIGGTGIQIGLVDEQGKIVERGGIVTRLEDGWKKQIADMAACAIDVVKRSGHTMEEVQAVGAGVPGLADQETGDVVFCTNLGWHDVPFKSEMMKYLNKPCFVDNDATVAGFAESVAGASAGTNSSILLTLGTGVGGAIIINGKPWSGAHGIGSELGHVILDLDGEPCTCGNRGCAERYCSATAVIRMAREALAGGSISMIREACDNKMDNINAKMVFDAARKEDPIGLMVFNRYVDCLAQMIASVINFIDPEVIVLGGGVSKAGDFLLDAVRKQVPKHVIFNTRPMAEIKAAVLGPDAGIIGAAMLGKEFKS